MDTDMVDLTGAVVIQHTLQQQAVELALVLEDLR